MLTSNAAPDRLHRHPRHVAGAWFRFLAGPAALFRRALRARAYRRSTWELARFNARLLHDLGVTPAEIRAATWRERQRFPTVPFT